MGEAELSNARTAGQTGRPGHDSSSWVPPPGFFDSDIKHVFLRRIRNGQDSTLPPLDEANAEREIVEVVWSIFDTLL